MENYVSINPDRLWARLNEVGHIGSDPRGGISRFAWEPPYKGSRNAPDPVDKGSGPDGKDRYRWKCICPAGGR